MHKLLIKLITIGLLIAVLPLATAKKIYKWQDEDGQIHYSEIPPTGAAGVNTFKLEKQAPASVETPARFKDEVPESIPTKQELTASQDSKGKQELAVRCEKYQDKYDHYTSRMRAGYKARQYNKLENKRRYYKQKLRQHCR